MSLTPTQRRVATAIAEFQHRNESLHRHPDTGKSTCSYCDLVGHYAVRTIVNHPGLLADLAKEINTISAETRQEAPSEPPTCARARHRLAPLRGSGAGCDCQSAVGPVSQSNAVKAKQARNEARTWPDWRTRSEDAAIEHDRRALDLLTTEGPQTDGATG